MLRDGRVVHQAAARDLTVREAVRLMVGAVGTGAATPPREFSSDAPVSLEVENLAAGRLLDVSLRLHEGEIVGVAGLDGSGVQDLFDALFGTRSQQAGSCRLQGEPYAPASPGDAMRTRRRIDPGRPTDRRPPHGPARQRERRARHPRPPPRAAMVRRRWRDPSDRAAIRRASRSARRA